jgi:hypothetical protein
MEPIARREQNHLHRPAEWSEQQERRCTMVEYHVRSEKCLWRVTGAVLFLLVLSAPCFGAEDGPPLFQVEQDWKTIVKSDENCSHCVRISKVAVKGMDVKKNSASVSIQVTGDWLGLKDCRSATGPCSGFSASGGINQVVSKTLRYRKLDTGWQVETKIAKSAKSSRHSTRKR